MKGKKYLQVSTKTWKQNPHSLFDFFAFEFEKSTFIVTQPGNVSLEVNKCVFSRGKALKGTDVLLSFTEIEENFIVSSGDQGNKGKLWQVVKNSNNSQKGYKLVEGDWLKIGKIIMLTKQVCVKNEGNGICTVSKFYGEGKSSENFVLEIREQGEDVCRICLSGYISEENPLVSPCKCSGTMKLIHLSCLQEWLKNKIISRVSNKVISFYKTDLICELCKQELPYKFRFNNKETFLVESLIPNAFSYVLFEEYSFDRTQKLALHIFSLSENQKAVIGRGSVCDLRFADITVSRKHCQIEIYESEFYLKDKRSKYGTLVEVKEDLLIEGSLSLQVDRTVFKIIEKETCSCSVFCWKRGANSLKNAVKLKPDESCNEMAEFMVSRSFIK